MLVIRAPTVLQLAESWIFVHIPLSYRTYWLSLNNLTHRCYFIPSFKNLKIYLNVSDLWLICANETDLHVLIDLVWFWLILFDLDWSCLILIRFPSITWKHPTTHGLLLRGSTFHGRGVMGMIRRHQVRKKGQKLATIYRQSSVKTSFKASS